MCLDTAFHRPDHDQRRVLRRQAADVFSFPHVFATFPRAGFPSPELRRHGHSTASGRADEQGKESPNPYYPTICHDTPKEDARVTRDVASFSEESHEHVTSSVCRRDKKHNSDTHPSLFPTPISHHRDRFEPSPRARSKPCLMNPTSARTRYVLHRGCRQTPPPTARFPMPSFRTCCFFLPT